MANRASWVHELGPADETAVGPSLVGMPALRTDDQAVDEIWPTAS
jgi:hypothetical protein